MKLDIFFVNTLLIIMVFVPYVLFILKASHESSKLKSGFEKLVTEYDLKPDWKESWNRNIIGVDYKNLKLLVVQGKETIVHKLVDLAGITKSVILSDHKLIKLRGKKEEQLQSLRLQLTYLDANVAEIELFNTSSSYFQDLELLHAQKLNDLINKLVVKKPTLTTAA